MIWQLMKKLKVLTNMTKQKSSHLTCNTMSEYGPNYHRIIG
jgi:hypothetical protein